MTRISLLLAAGVSVAALASAANAADLIIEEPAAPMVESYDGSWDGAYIGVFSGYGVGEAYAPDIDDWSLDLDGNWIAGLNAGVDFTLTDGVVVGVVADATYLGLDGIDDIGGGDFISYDLYWGGSLRGKVGFDGGAFMPYLTAGLAVGFGQVEGSGVTVSGEDANTHIGWTAGAGVEFAVTEDVSVDLLYKYTDYGAQDYTLQSGGVDDTESIGFTTHTVTAGVNWRF